MKVKELIEVLMECDKDLDVVDRNYRDVITVKEEKVLTHRNGDKNSTKHVIVEYEAE